jgi:hypothetical protein
VLGWGAGRSTVWLGGAAEFAKSAQASPPNFREPALCFENREIDNSQEVLSHELSLNNS